MGCDIHLHVEQKLGGKWVHLPRVPERLCSWCSGAGHYEGRPTEVCYGCKGTGKTTEPYGGRNYNLFAILADVRNGRGVAGIKTGDGFEPLDQPRGLPEDVSADVSGASTYWGVDGHNHSWFTLEELLTCDYDRTTGHCGVVSSPVYAEWVERKRTGSPSSWCGAVSGPNVEMVSNEEMQRLIMAGITPQKLPAGTNADWAINIPATDGKTYYTEVSWTETYRESVSKDWFAFLDALITLGPPHEVRIVFWFDN